MSDEMSYGCAARLRLALSHVAAVASDGARRLVETHADDDGAGGGGGGGGVDVVADAARLLDRAREMLALAVACERRRGASWEEIGAAIGISRHAARERYARIEHELDRALLTAWLDPEHAVDVLPAGAFDPGRAAARLDRWTIARRQPGDPAARIQDERIRRQPVSGALRAMTTDEHAVLLAAGSRLLAERLHDTGKDTPQYRRLEVGLLRRKVELYERILVEDPSDAGEGDAGQGDAGDGGRHLEEVRRSLASARRRLAALMAAAELDAGMVAEDDLEAG